MLERLSLHRRLLLTRAGKRLLQIGEIGGDRPGDLEIGGQRRSIRHDEPDVEPIEAYALPNANVDTALDHAVRIPQGRVIGDVGAATTELRQLRIHVHEVELVLRRDTLGAQPRRGAVHLEAQRREMARFAKIETGEKVLFGALAAGRRDEQRRTIPDIAYVGQNVAERSRHRRMADGP